MSWTPDLQHRDEDGAVDDEAAQQHRVRRQRMAATAQEPGEPDQRQQEGEDRGDGAALDAELRQAEAAPDQHRRDGEADRRRERQRIERRHGIADAAHHRREEQEDEEAGHGDEHDARIAGRGGQDVGGRADEREDPAREQPAEGRDEEAEQDGNGQRRAGDALHLVEFLCAEGLADQDRGAGAEADDEGDEEEQDREEGRDGGERVDADHLAEIDIVDRARQRLQDIGGDHRDQEEEEGPPERTFGEQRRRAGHGVILPARRVRRGGAHGRGYPPASLPFRHGTAPDRRRKARGPLPRSPAGRLPSRS